MELEVVVGSYDCMIMGYSIDLLCSPQEQRLRKKFSEKAHAGSVKCVASGGRYLASGSTDETIKLYNMRKHTDLGTLLQHEGTITFLSFYKDTHLFSASEDGNICIWKAGGNWDCLHTLSGHKYSVTCVSIHPSGRLALSVGKDRTVRTWNLLTGRAAFTLRLPKAANLVSWSPIADCYVLAVESSLMVYSVESGEPTAVIEVGKTINSILFVKESIVAVGSDQPSIHLYLVISGKLVTKLEGHTNRVKGLAVSPEETLLFSASSDGFIRAWSLLDPLENSKCVCSVDTGCRLTSITIMYSGQEVEKKRKTNPKTDKQVEEKRKTNPKNDKQDT